MRTIIIAALFVGCACTAHADDVNVEEVCFSDRSPRQMEIDQLSKEIYSLRCDWEKVNNRRKNYKREAERVWSHDKLDYRTAVAREERYELILRQLQARIAELEYHRDQLAGTALVPE